MAVTKTIPMEPVIFQGDGAQYTLIPYGKNGMPDMLRAYNSERSIVQSITRASTINMVNILDSNGNPAASRAQDSATTATIQMGAYDPAVESIMTGTNIANKESGSRMLTVSPEHIPASTEYKITMPKEAKPISKDEVKVEFLNGVVLELAGSASALQEGQFFYDSETGDLSFAAADADKDVLVTYWYDGKNVTTVEYENKMKSPTFMLIVRGTVYNKDETQAYYMNFVFDRATNNGDLTPPAQQADPTGGWQISIKSLSARAGKKPVTISFEPVVDAAQLPGA